MNLLEPEFFLGTLKMFSVVVVVALVGRELYDSSKTKKLECPICPNPYGKPFFESRVDNQTAWENGRCAKIEDNSGIAKRGFSLTYIFQLREGVECCLELLRYKNPYIIWVRWVTDLNLKHLHDSLASIRIF